ncbi:hypothetical protein [Polyangium jinanense]|uniref:Uncharacterized protein n=1 Tax=Polyangium jinanense TaxID=2829994 RepID=A0A9X3XI25_9BACT|nr:hypothetical protein [Polyangium jinanense]MDC3962636.1 hypothetical protein [Polyangium jinanense]MDC3989073.1 hypothetical protein [Polyangium jinanense]
METDREAMVNHDIAQELNELCGTLAASLRRPSGRVETSFGSFVCVDAPPHISVVPSSGRPVFVPRRLDPLFVPSKALMDAVTLDAVDDASAPRSAEEEEATRGGQTVSCPKLHAHLVASLSSRNVVKLSGLGELRIEKKGGKRRLSFKPSTVLKGALRGEPTEPVPLERNHPLELLVARALDHAMAASDPSAQTYPFVMYEAPGVSDIALVRFLELEGEYERLVDHARVFVRTLDAVRYALTYNAELRRNYGLPYDAVIVEVAEREDAFARVLSRRYGTTGAGPVPTDVELIGATENLLAANVR